MSGTVRGPNSFDLISVRQSTIDKLRNLRVDLGAENYDEVLVRLIAGSPPGAPVAPTALRSPLAPTRAAVAPVPRPLCGAPHRWGMRTITCRLRDVGHVRSAIPRRRRHVWWTHGGEKVTWGP